MKFFQSNEINQPQISALQTYPGGSVPENPTVSVIIPIFNEINHIHSVVDAVLAQDYAHIAEIIFFDGQSDDGTYEALQQIIGRDSRFRLRVNQRRNQAAAINLGFAQARGDIVMRLDAHARYAPNVIRRSVEALVATGAGGVGAIARPIAAETLISQSIVAAHQSKLGVGVAQFRQAAGGGWADTVWNGCYWKHVVDRVGPMREDLQRNEDNDFNSRVRALGYGLYLSPDIEAYYSPRQTLASLWEQYLSNGVGVAQTFFENRQAVSLRHFIPFMFVSSIIMPLALSLIWHPAWLLAVAVLALYLVAVLCSSILAYIQHPGGYAALLPVVFAVLHTSYGLGSMQGFLQIGYGAVKRKIQLLRPVT